MEYDLIRIDAVTKKFGEKEALKGISLTFKRCEIVSLLGVNGAGKTTLSSILATLRPPTSGDILFKGQSIYQDIPAFRRHIGYCPQKPNLNNDLTLYENLAFSGYYFGMNKQAVELQIEMLSERLGLKGYLHNRPASLSGGYKQRFVIARSLMHSPELIILDEPTVALDPQVRHQLWDYIKDMKHNGMTIVLTTHYLDEAEVLSDRVCVMDSGRIKLIDTPQNLMASFHKNNLEDVFLHLTQDKK